MQILRIHEVNAPCKQADEYTVLRFFHLEQSALSGAAAESYL